MRNTSPSQTREAYLATKSVNLGFARMRAALDAFEMSGSAVVMVNWRREVLRMNRLAEPLFGDDLRLVQGRIVSIDHDATASLDHALDLVIGSGGASRSLAPIVLPRQKGRPVLAYPSRLPCIAPDDFAPCQALVMLIDPDARIILVEPDLVRAFDLTPREARLASGLAVGHSLGSCASTMAIAYESARNMLKSIFQKTGTHRQAQLIVLLSQLAVGQQIRSIETDGRGRLALERLHGASRRSATPRD